MKQRKALFAVCDELLITLSGKIMASGTYTGDIGIAAEEILLPQLAFLFLLEMPTAEKFPLSIKTQITMPGEATPVERQFTLALPPMAVERENFVFYLPMLVQNAVARTGAIEAKIVFPDGEISAGSHMMVSQTVMQNQAAKDR